MYDVSRHLPKSCRYILSKCRGFHNSSIHILSLVASIHSCLQITEFLNWVSFGPLLLYAVTTVKKTTCLPSYLSPDKDWWAILCRSPWSMSTSMSRFTFSDLSLCVLQVIATLERRFLSHMRRLAGNSCLQRRAPKIEDLDAVASESRPSCPSPVCRKRLVPLPNSFVLICWGPHSGNI